MFPILEAGPTLEGKSLPAFVVARDGLYLRRKCSCASSRNAGSKALPPW